MTPKKKGGGGRYYIGTNALFMSSSWGEEEGGVLFGTNFMFFLPPTLDTNYSVSEIWGCEDLLKRSGSRSEVGRGGSE